MDPFKLFPIGNTKSLGQRLMEVTKASETYTKAIHVQFDVMKRNMPFINENDLRKVVEILTKDENVEEVVTELAFLMDEHLSDDELNTLILLHEEHGDLLNSKEDLMKQGASIGEQIAQEQLRRAGIA